MCLCMGVHNQAVDMRRSSLEMLCLTEAGCLLDVIDIQNHVFVQEKR